MQARERDVAGTQAASASQGLFRSVATTLAAKSLAIVGASERARWPSEIFRNLREFGYPGRIALVNPRQKAVFGQRCFPSLRDLDERSSMRWSSCRRPGFPKYWRPRKKPVSVQPRCTPRCWATATRRSRRRAASGSRISRRKAACAWAGPNCMGAYSYRERLFGYPNTDLCRLAPGSVAASSSPAD